jgi:hypothetical protein
MTGQGNRLAEVRALIADERRSAGDKPAAVGRIQRLCRAAARSLPATGVAVSLIAETGNQVTLASSGGRTERLEELQFCLGEGPCLEAYATRRPVITADLDAAAGTRWPGYVREVQEHGVRAVFAFPLQVGAARMGAMDVYRDEIGGLTQEALAQAFTFADVATTTLLDSQSSTGETDEMLRDAMDTRHEVFQAQGIVMVQLGVPLAEAVSRIRAYAYARSERLSDVANDIVAGKLVFEPDER